MNDPRSPDRHHPAHFPPVARWNQPIVLMTTVGLRKPNDYHCLDNEVFLEALLNAWQRSPEWKVGHFMIMPDHVHFFCTPGDSTRSAVTLWTQKWKSFISTQLQRPAWRWLPGCWDTQMRDIDHYSEKRAYVKMNPVRKGLADTPHAWRYQGMVHTITWL